MTVDTARTETQLAADVVWLLLVNGVIDRRHWNAHQLANTVGCTVEELDTARLRCETEGYETLRPDPSADRYQRTADGPVCPDPAAHEPRNAERGTRNAHPGEKRCPRCGEWRPVELFAAEPTRRRGTVCEVCVGELERDHFVAIRKARPLHQVMAHFTATKGDAVVGMTCGRCHEPVQLGEQLTVQAEPVHVKCPKVRR